MVDSSSPANPQNWKLETFDRQAILNIVADPAAYQFRPGMNGETGELESRKINGEWNPLQHGKPLLLHKRNDGKYYVVDGHHRLAFAKRLIAEGKGPESVAAYVLEEEKGISVMDAKHIAARLDIADGHTPLSHIAALIKEQEAEKQKPDSTLHMSMMPDVKIPEAAYKLSSLSLKSLGLINQMPAEVAIEVVDKVKDRSRHDRIIEYAAHKFRQDYPNYQPNMELASVLSPRANDNAPAGFVSRLKAERAAAQRSFAQGA